MSCVCPWTVQWCRDACRVAGTRQPSRESRTGGRLGRKGWVLWKEVSRVGPSHSEAGHGFLLTLGDRDSTGILAGFSEGSQSGRAWGGVPAGKAATGGRGCEPAALPATDRGVSLDVQSQPRSRPSPTSSSSPDSPTTWLSWRTDGPGPGPAAERCVPTSRNAELLFPTSWMDYALGLPYRACGGKTRVT